MEDLFLQAFLFTQQNHSDCSKKIHRLRFPIASKTVENIQYAL